MIAVSTLCDEYTDRPKLSEQKKPFVYIYITCIVKCGERGECGEKKNSPHFTAILTKFHREIHQISNKNSPHMISKVYSISFKFTRKFRDVSDSWRSGLRSGRQAAGQRFEHVWG